MELEVNNNGVFNTLENVRAGYDEYVSGTKIDEQRGGLYG